MTRRPFHRWWAHLAPLGVPTTDRRILATTGRFTLATSDFLIRAGSGVVGSLARVTTRAGWLIAIGITSDPDTIAGIQTHTLWPALALTDTVTITADGLTVFTSGTVGSVMACPHSPAWDGARFHLSPPITTPLP